MTNPTSQSLPSQAPFSQEAEEALLGAVLLDSNTFLNIVSFLAPDDFFLKRHEYVWMAFSRLQERNDPMDYVTVSQELNDMRVLDEIGGQAFLTYLVNNTPSSVHAEVYGRVVERAAIRRKMLEATDEIRKLALDEEIPIDKVISDAEQTLFSVSESQVKREFVPMWQAVSDYYDDMEKLLEAGAGLVGIPTGFKALDGLLGGFQKSDLIVFAGRPGMGKTSFLLTVALNIARVGARVALFTMEMGVEQMVQRLISMETGIKMQQLRTADLSAREHARFTEAVGRIANLPIFIDDTPAINPIEMRTKCRRLQHEYGLDLVMVDYMQLMSAGKAYENNRVQEISYISRSLKELARELNVTLLSAAQLSRAVEQRQDKRPQLSDLRESGCLAGETQVYLPDEGYSVPISSLVGKKNFRVLSLNTNTWKLEYGKVTHAFCTGTKPVYRLTTALGRTIRATANHKFLTIEGWKRLDELEVKSHISLPRSLPVTNSLSMKDSELALMGHLIGDGCTLPRHAIQYTTIEYDLAEIVSDLSQSLFGERVAPRISKESGYSWYQVFLPTTEHITHNVRNPISEWLEDYQIFGLRSHEKFIPKQVFAQSNEKIALFLRHLWSTDGCINMRKSGNGRYPIIYYATSSLQLAQDVATLLLRFNINARLKRVSQGNKGRDQFHVLITGHQDLKNFTQTVKAVGEKKCTELHQVIEYLKNNVANTNRDIIPKNIWRDYAVPSMQSHGITSRQMQAELGNAYCGTTLYKQNVSRERASRLAEVVNSEEIKNLSQSDVYWDQIVSIEPDGETAVYDLTVDTYHNFCADLMIVHNSIEQDADAVMFLYRDEVYNPETTEFPNQADVLLSKHRHGPTGTISLYFEKSITKFMDVNMQRVDLSDLE